MRMPQLAIRLEQGVGKSAIEQLFGDGVATWLKAITICCTGQILYKQSKH